MYTPNLTLEKAPKATTPRVPKNYVISPRVQTPSETQDATEFIYPKRGIWNEQTKESEKPPSPKLRTRPKADAGNLRSSSTPAQNTWDKTTQEQPI